MSFFKATWWRPAIAVAVLAIAVGVLSLTGAGTAHAGGDGTITVSPADLQIGAGGSGQVSVMLTPGSAGVSVWIIQIAYDPAVAQVALDSDSHPVCTFVSVADPLVGAGGCFTKAVNHGSTPDTLVILGGVVQNDNGVAKGFTTQQTLATFTFDAVGAAGASTPLTTTVTSLLDPSGATPAATASNGAIDIIASQGTDQVWGDGDCSAAVAPRDGQGDLAFFLGKPAISQGTGCPAIGATVMIGGVAYIWGDWDCSGAVAPRDGQGDLAHFLGKPEISQGTPCFTMGATVTVS